jgi:hypothetical protein
LIESEYVESIERDPERVAVPRSRTKRQQIYRCPTCETAVWSTYSGKGVFFVRAGTLDDPTAATPDVHIYTRSKVPWLSLPESALVFTTYYDTNKIWPEASLERLAAAATRSS